MSWNTEMGSIFEFCKNVSLLIHILKFLLHEKMLGLSKLKAFADKKSKLTRNQNFEPAFSPFPTMFSTHFKNNFCF